MTVVLYAAAPLRGVSLARFAKALAPAQAVAFSARSSFASLPAMLEGARTRLGLGVDATGVVLPLAVTTLRVSTPIMWSVTIPFLARLYGVPLSPGELVLLVGLGILLSFSTPGLPSASLFLMAPFLGGLGIPVEALGLAIAADTIPDLFKGVLNVTGVMATGVMVADTEKNGP
jgi:proton glutamate symport protein